MFIIKARFGDDVRLDIFKEMSFVLGVMTQSLRGLISFLFLFIVRKHVEKIKRRRDLVIGNGRRG